MVSDAQTDAPRRSTRLPRSARRRQLLAAAQEVFVAQGYHAAAMDEIAEAAGVSKPVLYQHFPSKLDLYLALLDRHCDDLVARVRSALESTADNKQRVSATLAAYFGFVAGDGEAFRLVFESDLRNEGAVRERVERALRECADAIATTIAKDTGVAEDEARLLSVGLAGCAEIGARFWLTAPSAVDRERAVELLSALCWRGIGSFPRAGDPSSVH
ncbi:MAG: TetR/AcrR family transcriptional regulator [Actinomycetes bacterium]